MKKILTLILVSLSSLGIFATANQVFALKPVEAGMYVYYETQDDYYDKVVKADFIYPSAVELTFENGSKTTVESFSEEKLQYDSFGLRAVGGKMITVHDSYGEELDEVIAIDFPQPDVASTYKLTFADGTVKTFIEYEASLQDSFWIKFNVSGEDLRPAISGQETFATKVDEARPVEYFIGFLKAIDDIDGDISKDIYIVTDNYTPNKSVLGTHAVTVGVEDSSGNVSEFIFRVSVVDIDAPIINGNATAVSIGYKETYNIANFKSTLTVTDNYDTLSASDITIKSDNYTTNKTKLGTWNVVFEVTDSSGNTSTFTKPIKVIDNVAPLFSGIETLTKSYTEVMTLSDIVAQVTANDEIDGNLTNKISVVNDGFTGKSNKVGTHYIELSVTDNAGNTSTRTLTIKVIDDQSAGWFITNGVSINLTPGTELTRTQIVELLHKSGQVLAPANARITYLTDTYSDNVGMPGTYTLAFRTVLTNGQENAYTYAVNVLDDKTEDDTEVLPGLPFYEENKILIWLIGGAGLLAAAYFIFKPKKKKK